MSNLNRGVKIKNVWVANAEIHPFLFFSAFSEGFFFIPPGSRVDVYIFFILGPAQVMEVDGGGCHGDGFPIGSFFPSKKGGRWKSQHFRFIAVEFFGEILYNSLYLLVLKESKGFCPEKAICSQTMAMIRHATYIFPFRVFFRGNFFLGGESKAQRRYGWEELDGRGWPSWRCFRGCATNISKSPMMPALLHKTSRPFSCNSRFIFTAALRTLAKLLCKVQTVRWPPTLFCWFMWSKTLMIPYDLPLHILIGSLWDPCNGSLLVALPT